MSEKIYIEYNNKMYIKINTTYPNREKLKSFDKILIITQGEFDTISSIFKESGEEMLPLLVSLKDEKLKSNQKHLSSTCGLYINENEYNSLFDKKYPYVLINDDNHQNEIYVQLSFLNYHNLLDGFNIGYYFYKFLTDSNKLQILTDNDYNTFSNIFKLQYSQKPQFIIPISKCNYVHNYNTNNQHYVRLNSLHSNEINYLNNL